MLSPVIWTSTATGVEPARHGILDFLAPSANGASEPVASSARKAPTVWELLSAAGAPVGVTGVVGDLARGSGERVHGHRPRGVPVVRLQLRPPIGRRKNLAGVGLRDGPSVDRADGRDSLERRRPVSGRAARRPEDFDAEERQRLDEFRTLRRRKDLSRRRPRDAPKADVRFESVYFEDGHGRTPLHVVSPAEARHGGSARVRVVPIDGGSVLREADRMLGRPLAGREGGR